MTARKDAWGRTQLARRQRLPLLPGVAGFIARPEDIIISKMLYYQEGGSEKHLRDIAGMFKISREQIDADYVARWAAQLDVLDIWQAILKRVGEAPA